MHHRSGSVQGGRGGGGFPRDAYGSRQWWCRARQRGCAGLLGRGYRGRDCRRAATEGAAVGAFAGEAVKRSQELSVEMAKHSSALVLETAKKSNEIFSKTASKSCRHFRGAVGIGSGSPA